ncbi:hypothetical protein [Scytonema millei]|uniref:Uncharacterized protein n=1 Tax=Scytonema millei VB511283 TaxID=1245923 RepID=A0A9X5E1B0_9CYAN|nr:hypothetical protein [Scytonema millei]NHC33611.1 hypothetical protein [Scytonema millei VB511283]
MQRENLIPRFRSLLKRSGIPNSEFSPHPIPHTPHPTDRILSLAPRSSLLTPN